MKIIRGGSGLGDSMYVRPVAEHYARADHRVIVKSNYPDVFIGAGVKVDPFTRLGTNVLAHYTSRKDREDTTQWQDVAINAGVPGLELSFKWEIQNKPLVNDLKAMARGKPIIMVNGGRPPMNRTDGYGYEMLPNRKAFDRVLAALEGCFTVEVGKGEELYPLTADVDLNGRTTPGDLLDIASISSGLVGQCSFMIPLAEALDKPLLVVWAAKGLESKTLYIRQCRPEKILSKPSSRWVMDDWAPESIKEVALAFRRFF